MLVADYDSDQEDTMAKRLEEQAAAEKAKADAALAAAASSSEDSDDSDHDSDEEEEDGDEGKGKGRQGQKKQPVTKLPSALELLETTEAPSFLSVPSHQPAFDVQPMKAPERHAERPQHARRPPREEQQYQRRPPPQHQEAGMPPPPPARRQQQATRAEEEEAAKRRKEKVDAKERVKRQRLAGQSGIGSDFRTWKSEAEMVMRQQYD